MVSCKGVFEDEYLKLEIVGFAIWEERSMDIGEAVADLSDSGLVTEAVTVGGSPGETNGERGSWVCLAQHTRPPGASLLPCRCSNGDLLRSPGCKWPCLRKS